MKNCFVQPTILAMALIMVVGSFMPVFAQQSQNAKPTRGHSQLSGPGGPLPNDNDQTHIIAASLNLTNSADTAVKQGDWTTASKDYKQAIQYWPANKEAHYALGDHDVSTDDIADAVVEYRGAIYTHPEPPRLPRIDESNVQRLMKYALLLYQTGQTVEALNIYADGAQKFNYDQGKPARRVMLPSFGSGSGQLPLTSQNFQGMAHLGIGVDTLGHEGYVTSEPLDNLRKAVQLAPDSAAAHYYLADYFYGENNPDAKTEFKKAASLGDDQVRAAVERELKFVR